MDFVGGSLPKDVDSCGAVVVAVREELAVEQGSIARDGRSCVRLPSAR